jgi:MFS family permease
MTNSFAVGWRQVAVGFLMVATVSMIASCYSIVAVPLLNEFHPTRFVLGLAMTVLSGVSAVLSPLFGNLMDRVSLRWTMLAGGVLIAVGYAAMSFAGSFNQILVCFGLFVAPANVLLGPVAVTVLLSRWFSKRRGLVIGIAIAGVAMGTIVYPKIIGLLLGAYDWRQALQVFGLVLLAITIPAALLVVNHPHDRGLHADGADEDPQAIRDAHKVAPITTRQVLSDPTFWLAVIVFGTVTSGMKGMITNLAPLAVDNGVAIALAVGLTQAYGMAGLVAKVGFATLADRVSPRILMIASLFGFAAGLLCLTQAQYGYAAILTGVWLIGMFGGLMVPMQSLLMPRIFGERVVGKAYGLMSGFTLLLLMSTPALFGLIFDLTGSYSAIFLTFAGLAMLALIAVAFMRFSQRAGPEPVIEPVLAAAE